MAKPTDPSSDVVTETTTEKKLKKPPLYKVIFHNDNYTTMEFVVAVLRQVFHKTESEAINVMLQVHSHGFGVAGVYTYDVAETKIRMVETVARDNEFPLKLSMEPEDS